MDSIVLTTDEIYELTHYRRAAEQMRALAAMGIPAYLRKHDNTVCVLRAVVTTAPNRLPTQSEPMLKSTRKRLELEAAQVKEVAASVRKARG